MPALMPFMENRALTNYLPSCCLNTCLMHKYGTPTNYDYRQFVLQNGDRVMADLRAGTVCHSLL